MAEFRTYYTDKEEGEWQSNIECPHCSACLTVTSKRRHEEYTICPGCDKIIVMLYNGISQTVETFRGVDIIDLTS